MPEAVRSGRSSPTRFFPNARFFAEFIGLEEPPGRVAAAHRGSTSSPGLRGSCRRVGPRPSAGPRPRRREILAGRGPVLRREPAADLGFLATGAAHGPPSSPGRHMPSRCWKTGYPQPTDLLPTSAGLERIPPTLWTPRAGQGHNAGIGVIIHGFEERDPWRQTSRGAHSSRCRPPG